MCSNVKEPGNLRISQTTYKKITSNHINHSYFFKKEELFIKGKGLMKTYLAFPQGTFNYSLAKD